MNEKSTPKCAIYIRVGTPEQLDTKKEQLISFARQKDMDVTGIYQDIGSGLDFNRKSLHKMLEDIRMNKVDTVVVNGISDIGRDMLKTVEYIQELNRKGVTFLSPVSGVIDVKLFSNMMEKIYPKRGK